VAGMFSLGWGREARLGSGGEGCERGRVYFMILLCRLIPVTNDCGI